ncbi:hypothetical protein J3E69DRAFT_166040 [Trichoderma sp. SZMC 28015]
MRGGGCGSIRPCVARLDRGANSSLDLSLSLALCFSASSVPASSTPAGIARPIGGSRCHGCSLPQTIQTIVSDPRVRGTWGTGETWGTSILDGIVLSLAASCSRPPSLIIITIYQTYPSPSLSPSCMRADTNMRFRRLATSNRRFQCRVPSFKPPPPPPPLAITPFI